MAGATRDSVQGGGYLHKWNLTNADGTGDKVSIVGAADRSVHIYGTFGSATIVFQGTNDPDAGSGSWITLNDISGAAISATEIYIAMVAENTIFIRPVLTGGSGSTVSVRVLSRMGR